jgi:L-ascorbate metabolism protein UlaG (beta-lactamase superfamily)
MNLPFTMSPEDAAMCAKAFKPKIVYPYHYLSDDPNATTKFDAAMKGAASMVRLRNWYAGAPERGRR